MKAHVLTTTLQLFIFRLQLLDSIIFTFCVCYQGFICLNFFLAKQLGSHKLFFSLTIFLNNEKVRHCTTIWLKQIVKHHIVVVSSLSHRVSTFWIYCAMKGCGHYREPGRSLLVDNIGWMMISVRKQVGENIYFSQFTMSFQT